MLRLEDVVPGAVAKKLADLEQRLAALLHASGLAGILTVTGPDGTEYTTNWAPTLIAHYDAARNTWFDNTTGAVVLPMEMAPPALQPPGWTYVSATPPAPVVVGPSPDPGGGP